jgi:hypothetical protein
VKLVPGLVDLLFSDHCILGLESCPQLLVVPLIEGQWLLLAVHDQGLVHIFEDELLRTIYEYTRA